MLHIKLIFVKDIYYFVLILLHDNQWIRWLPSSWFNKSKYVQSKFSTKDSHIDKNFNKTFWLLLKETVN